MRQDFYVFLFQGGAGTGKTACALSGEGLTGYNEFDARSYSRATSGIHIDESKILLAKHPAPVDALWDLGRITVGQTGGVGSNATRSLKGWLEAYKGFLTAYSEQLANDEVEQVIMDTETKLWLLIRNGWQQQIQEAQRANNKAELERMDALKYTEANSRYAMVTEAAATYGKHLILISHLKEEWVGQAATGRMVHDGNKEAPNNADLQLEFSIERKKPVAVIRKSLGHLDLVGMKIEEPTVGKLVGLLDGVKTINKSGLALPTPLTLDAVVGLAESLRD